MVKYKYMSAHCVRWRAGALKIVPTVTTWQLWRDPLQPYLTYFISIFYRDLHLLKNGAGACTCCRNPEQHLHFITYLIQGEERGFQECLVPDGSVIPMVD